MVARVEPIFRNNESPIMPLGRQTVFQALKFVMPMVILAAAAFALMHRTNKMVLPIILTFATAAGMGVVSGISTRWALRYRAGLLQALVAIAEVVIGLEILGLITFGQAGLDMLFHRRTDIDWVGLGQIVAGALTALIAVRAWPKRALPIPDTFIQEEPRLEPPENPAPELRISAPLQPRVSFPIPRTARNSRLHLPVLRRPRLGVPRFPRLSWRRRSQVHMNADEEHRCPYCLDLIERKDRRGVKVCPECHTWHHADCWAIAGMCQVPHHHS